MIIGGAVLTGLGGLTLPLGIAMLVDSQRLGEDDGFTYLALGVNFTTFGALFLSGGLPLLIGGLVKRSKYRRARASASFGFGRDSAWAGATMRF